MAELLYVVLALVVWLGPAAFAIFLARRPLLVRLENLEQELQALTRKVDRLTAGVSPAAPTPIVPTVQAETIVAPPSASPDASLPVSPKSAPVHKPAPPPTPSVMQRVADAVNLDESPLVRWFVSVHLLVRVAVIVLFFGVGFLLKYVVDQGWMTVEMRLLGATLLGVGMMAVGWRVREARRIYGLTLQGGGFGIVYMTVFAAFRLYALLPAPMAFGLMVTLVALGGGLAVLNNAMSVAILALAGGFAAPFLTSSGAGSHVTLFSYYLILNVGILGIAWFKAWRPLNLLAFLFTLGLGAFWGVEAYQPTFFATTEPFLITFALFFVGVSLLFARHFPDGADTVDTVMVFGTPVAFLGLQSTLVGDIPYGMANSTLAVGLFYLLLAGVLFVRRVESFRILREFFLLFGIIGLSLTVPLRFDDQWTSGIWALEGAGLVWSGVRRKQPLGWLVGILLQFGAAIFWVTFVDLQGWGAGWVDAVFVGSVLISLGGLISAYAIRGQAPSDTIRISAGDVNVISIALGLWGLGWWFGGGAAWIEAHSQVIQLSPFFALFLALSVVAAEEVGRRLTWTLMRLPFLGLGPGLGLLALGHILGALIAPFEFGLGYSPGSTVLHLLSNIGLLAWPVGLFAFYYGLYRQGNRPWASLYHGIGVWLVALLAGLEGWWLITWGLGQMAADNVVWISLGLLGPAALILLGIGVLAWRRVSLLQRRPGAYLLLGSVPLVALLGMWSFLINLAHSGDPEIFRYVPLLNPLDLLLVLILVSLGVWVSQLSKAYDSPSLIKVGWFGLTGLGFLGFNAMLARTAHHLWGVDFRFDALLHAPVLQATYAITWSAIALVLMFWATGRGKRRGAWMVGAALLALTVAKLFLVDLGQAATIPRIISFLGVGLLMLVIGYFAPAPPAEAKVPPPSLSQVEGGDESP